LPSRLRRATLPWSFTEYSDVAEDGNLAAEGEFYMQVNFAKEGTVAEEGKFAENSLFAEQGYFTKDGNFAVQPCPGGQPRHERQTCLGWQLNQQQRICRGRKYVPQRDTEVNLAENILFAEDGDSSKEYNFA
jgi:hypothetical protein